MSKSKWHWKCRLFGHRYYVSSWHTTWTEVYYSCRRCGFNPDREYNLHRMYSPSAQRAWAQLQITLDEKRGLTTPQWVKDLANE